MMRKSDLVLIRSAERKQVVPVAGANDKAVRFIPALTYATKIHGVRITLDQCAERLNWDVNWEDQVTEMDMEV